VNSLADLKLAPFHLLATEGHVHADKDHLWHMELLGAVCRTDHELLQETLTIERSLPYFPELRAEGRCGSAPTGQEANCARDAPAALQAARIRPTRFQMGIIVAKTLWSSSE
jgi:PNKP adenylyltransferase domain, ligase domain